MNKLIVSLLLTLGITGAAVAAEGPVQGDATAVEFAQLWKIWQAQN